jgi:uncharacterized protein YkwD
MALDPGGRAMGRWVLLVAVGVVGCSSPGERLPRGQMPPRDTAGQLDADALQAVITLTNEERHKARVPPLTVDPRLTDAAERHADRMARRDRLSHTLDGRSAADRVRAAGYEYRTVGENIAWNQRSAAEVVGGWMDSRGHRRNLLSKEFTHIGVAVSTNAKGEPYWVQVFGSTK